MTMPRPSRVAASSVIERPSAPDQLLLLPSIHVATPPWCEQVPVWCFDFEYVPSLHLAVAPVGSVLPASSAGIDLVAVEFLAAVDGEPEAGTGDELDAGGGLLPAVLVALGLAAEALPFCTPP